MLVRTPALAKERPGTLSGSPAPAMPAEGTHFILWGEHFPFTPASPTPTFCNILVHSNVNFPTLLSGANSKFLKNKTKQALLMKGYRCSVICLSVKVASPQPSVMYKFQLCWTVSDYIKHYCIADSTVTKWNYSIDCIGCLGDGKK